MRREEESAKKREKEREGGRGSLRSSIGRFKDDHALSAIHHTTLRLINPLRPTETPGGSQTAWKQPLNFRAASFGWQRTSSFAVQVVRKRTVLGHVREKRGCNRNHAYIPRKIANTIFFDENLVKKRHFA